MAFYGPIYALFNLFIYILLNPNSSNIHSDVALLDICAGHFARLEFATDSNISIPLVREVAALARDVVNRHELWSPKNGTQSFGNAIDDLSMPFPTSQLVDTVGCDTLQEGEGYPSSSRDVSEFLG